MSLLPQRSEHKHLHQTFNLFVQVNQSRWREAVWSILRTSAARSLAVLPLPWHVRCSCAHVLFILIPLTPGDGEHRSDKAWGT